MCDSIQIETDFPIAIDSPDHITPLGTKIDNSHNSRFIKRCEQIITRMHKDKGTILDIGCAGAGCVEDFVLRGHDAYGIEGSNYSKIHQRAAWKNIPDHLFTCDASQYFRMKKNGKLILFDIIFSFEVMEHIPIKGLPTYFKNIYRHMAPLGLFIGSFTTTKSKKFPMHHQTIMGKKQWFKFIDNIKLFKRIDLRWKKREYLRFSKLKTNCIPISFVRKDKCSKMIF